MAIVNPNIPLQALNIPPVQIRQPESMVQSLSAIAPGINAMRQLQVSQAEQQEKVQQRQALEAMRKQNLDPVGIGKWLMTNGRTSQEIQLGFNIYKTATEDESFRQAFGGQPAEMPANGAAMPAQGGAAAVAAPMAQTAAQPAAGAFGMTPDRLARIAASGERGAKYASTMAQFVPKPQAEPAEIATMRSMGLDPKNMDDVKRFYAAKQPQLGTAEARLELDRRRLDLDNLRLRQTQAKNEADSARLQAQIDQQERRFALDQRKFDRESDPDYQSRMAAAKAFATEAAKNDATLAQQGPSAIQSGEQTLALLNRMVGDPKGKGSTAQPHPGFVGVVGATLTPGMRFVQGSAEADFDAMLEQVLGGAFLEAYERLKGTGQITEIEGKKATQAITRMQRAVSESEFLQAAKEFRSSLETAMERTRARMQKSSSSTAPARATPATDQDAQAREWLRQNPNHPRAAEIRKALGE